MPAATIGSADIIDESIQSVGIRNGQVKASDIATDAITADEIKGVSKLIFAHCMLTSAVGGANIAVGEQTMIECTISGVDYDDSGSDNLNNTGPCVEVVHAVPYIGRVDVFMKNDC